MAVPSSMHSYPSVIYAGKNFAFNISRESSSYLHDVKFSFFTKSYTITGVGSSGSFDIPLAWISEIPNQMSGNLGIIVTTKEGSKVIGGRTYYVSLKVPNEIVPTLPDFTLSLVQHPKIPTWAQYIQNASSVKIDYKKASGVFGSTIKDYRILYPDKSYQIVDPNLVQGSRTVSTGVHGSAVPYEIVVTDSRGQKTSIKKTISVIQYWKPSITSFDTVRCDSSGNPSATGTYLRISASALFTTIGTQNQKKLTYSYGPKVVDPNQPSVSGPITSGSYVVVGDGKIDPNKEYKADVYAEDSIYWAAAYKDIPTAYVTMDFLAGGRGISFGKVASLPNTLDSDYAINPAGGIKLPKLENVTDLNLCTTPGVWCFSGGAQNEPATGGGSSMRILEVQTTYRWDGTTIESVVQKITYPGMNASNKAEYRREYSSIRNPEGGTPPPSWGPWVSTFPYDNPWSVTHDASGRTSGNAIYGGSIRTNSRENTLEHWISIRTNVELPNAYASVYQGTVRWYFPKVYAEVPTVSCSKFQWQTSASWGAVAGVTKDYVDLRGTDYFKRQVGWCDIQAYVIGKYK